MSLIITAPPLVTETDSPTPWTDCTWASGLMAALVVNPTIPPTRAERLALKAAGGPLSNPPGATLDELAHGLTTRYGIDLGRPDIVSGSGLADYFATGGAAFAVLQGDYGALNAHYSRWDASFTGGHAVGVGPVSPIGNARSGYLWWMDPLASGYVGEWIDYASLNAYAAGLSRHYLVGTVEAIMAALVVSDPKAALVDLAVGTQLLDLNGKALVKLSSGGAGLTSPFASGAHRAVVITTGGVTQLALVATTAATNVRPISDTKHQVSIAVDGIIRPATVTSV